MALAKEYHPLRAGCQTLADKNIEYELRSVTFNVGIQEGILLSSVPTTPYPLRSGFFISRYPNFAPVSHQKGLRGHFVLDASNH